MRKLAIVVLLIVVGSVAAVAQAEQSHSEKVRHTGRVAHGSFTSSQHGRWLVVVRRGAHSARVKNGEGISASEVSDGRFTVRLPVGTSTLGGWPRGAGVIEGRLCGVRTVTVRAGAPIPVIHLDCSGA
jgi:hypothetical protein